MAARYVDVLESEIDQFKENAVPEKKKKKKGTTKFGFKLFKGTKVDKISLLQYLINSLKVSATFSNFCEILCSTEWFQ